MIKSNFVPACAFLTLLALSSPHARAGCGKELVSKLLVLVPDARTAGSQLVSASSDSESSSDPDTPTSASQAAANAGAPVGLWSTNVLLSGQVIYQAFESFTGDGLEFLNDNGSPLEGNVCFGTWATARGNTIKVYHPSWNYDTNGNLIGTVIIKERVTVNPDGKSFKGSVVVDSYDLNGAVSAPELQAQITGSRITAN